MTSKINKYEKVYQNHEGFEKTQNINAINFTALNGFQKIR